MIPAQNIKIVQCLDPVSGTGAASMDDDIDTLGFDYCQIIVSFGAVGAAVAGLSVSESDDDSTYTAIAAANFAGGTQIDGTTAALASIVDDSTIVFEVDCKGRQRWLRPVLTRGGTATLCSIVAVLSRRAESNDTLTGIGATGAIRV